MKLEVGDLFEFYNENEYWDGNTAAVVAHEEGSFTYKVKIVDDTKSKNRNDLYPKGTEFDYRQQDVELHARYVGKVPPTPGFPDLIRELPVGSIFRSPFTDEPMVRVSEDEVAYGLNTPHPSITPLKNVSNAIVQPLVVIYQP